MAVVITPTMLNGGWFDQEADKESDRRKRLAEKLGLECDEYIFGRSPKGGKGRLFLTLTSWVTHGNKGGHPYWTNTLTIEIEKYQGDYVTEHGDYGVNENGDLIDPKHVCYVNVFGFDNAVKLMAKILDKGFRFQEGWP